MADSKISALASHGTPVGADYVASVLASGPTSKKLLLSDVRDYIAMKRAAGTDADTTMVVNTTYVVDMSAWATADRNYTLPTTGAAGDRIRVVILAGDASHELILKTGAGQTCVLAGASIAAATEITRLFIAGEAMTFLYEATDSWVVESMTGLDSYKFSIRQNGNVSSQQTLTTAAFDPIEGDVLNTVVYNVGDSVTNVGSAADVTFTARRAGRYLFGGIVIQIGQGASADKKVINGVVVNGDATDGLYMLSRGFNSVNSGIAGFGGSVAISLSVGDYVTLNSYAEEAATVVHQADNYSLFWGQWESV